jgi:peptide/nickel transport system substrate-binding protein
VCGSGACGRVTTLPAARVHLEATRMRSSDPSIRDGLSRRLLLTGVGGAALLGAPGCDLLSTDPDGDGSGREPFADGAKEAPMLARRVAAGELPPLKERLPRKPLVVQPLKRSGRYGGTLRGTSLAPATTSDLQTTMVPSLFRFSHDLAERHPEVAESFDFNADFTTCVIRLREGLRWSDGEPFTADDVIFYFEDWQFDEELSPIVAPQWVRDGERMQVSKRGDHAVQFDFAVATPSFALLNYTGAPAEPYVPAHFLKRFHPRYNPDAESEAKDAGYGNWLDQFTYFAAAHYGVQSPKRPVLDPWMPVEMGDQRQRYERNPYYWKVDPEGRQLPYVDEVVIDYVGDIEVTNLRAVSGAVSVAGLDLTVRNYPVIKNGEEDGNYRAALLTSERGADVAVALNQEHKDPALREIFRDLRFRQALSVAINRDEINSLVFLRRGTPRQATINEQATFFRKEWADHFAQHDPDLANELLDSVGLDRRDPDGVRLRPDGRRMSFQLEFLPHEGPKTEVAELVVKHWQDVGLNVSAQPRDRTYLLTRLEAGDHDASAWHVDRQLERSAYAYGAYSSKLGPGGDSAVLYANGWRTWLRSGGTDGVEPPDEAKELDRALHAWQLHEMGTPEYDELARRIHELIARTLWVIGIVGQAPSPVLVSNDLENVLPDSVFSGDETLWWGAANWFWHPHRAEQWFFTSEQ